MSLTLPQAEKANVHHSMEGPGVQDLNSLSLGSRDSTCSVNRHPVNTMLSVCGSQMGF